MRGGIALLFVSSTTVGLWWWSGQLLRMPSGPWPETPRSTEALPGSPVEGIAGNLLREAVGRRTGWAAGPGCSIVAPTS